MKWYRKWREFFDHSKPNVNCIPIRNACIALFLGGLVLFFWNTSGAFPKDILLGSFVGILCAVLLRNGLHLTISGLKTTLLLLVGFHASLIKLKNSGALGIEVLFLILLDLGILFRLHLIQWSREIFLQSLKTILKTIGVAIPFLLFLVFLFRSVYHRASEGPHDNALSGMSEHLIPGGISNLKLQQQTAFQVQTQPSLDTTRTYYWRVATLSHSKGMEWDGAVPYQASAQSSRDSCPADCPLLCKVEQVIIPWDEDSEAKVALDYPSSSAFSLPHFAHPFPATSSLCPFEVGTLTAREKHLYLHVDSESGGLRTPAVEELIRLWKKEKKGTQGKPGERRKAEPEAQLKGQGTQAHLSHNSVQNHGVKPQTLIDEALLYFSSSGFHYSLQTQPRTQPLSLEQFIFQERVGFCEHYAAAFSTLMRLAGIPSRVVVGFLGGNYNPYGNFWNLTLAHAHAWSEVWIDGKWLRVDPTAFLHLIPPTLTPSHSIFEPVGLLGEALRFKATVWASKHSLTKMLLGAAVLAVLLFLFLKFLSKKRALSEFFKTKTAQTEFEDAFQKLLHLLATRTQARSPLQGYEEYRLQIHESFKSHNLSPQYLNSLDGIFHFYQMARFSNLEISPDQFRQERQKTLALLKTIRKVH